MNSSNDASPRTILFIGDSITDAGRRDDPDGLGRGYVRLVAEALCTTHPDVRVINRGIGGDRSRDVVARLDTDCIEERPDVVSVLIGVNDVLARYIAEGPTSAQRYEQNLRTILTRAREDCGAALVLAEPFLLPAAAEAHYREDLDPKIAVVRRLVDELGATFVALDERLARWAEEESREAIAPDGVHPSPVGHRIIADAWLKAAADLLE